MDNDEEPPALSSSGPPPAAFASGGPPPPSAFGSSSSSSSDLNSRWKQYETERSASNGSNGSSKKKTSMVGPDGHMDAHSDYDLYETPQKPQRPNSTTNSTAAEPRQLYSNRGTDSAPTEGPLEPRRTYSFTKSSSSSSYNTNDLIAKYAGVSGMPPAASTGIPRALSNASTSASLRRGSDSITPSARAEAQKVLAMADEQMSSVTSNSNSGGLGISSNQPFQVRRTESGGFRASIGAEQGPPYFMRSNSTTNGNGRRTPSALSGLGLGRSPSNDWKSNRYAFSDPKFREDDYLEEEDDIIGPAVTDPLEEQIEVTGKTKSGIGYRDHAFDNMAFDGDFPRHSGVEPTWSSRYSDTPNGNGNGNVTSGVLDRFDRNHAQTQNQPGSNSRQNARKMFMATASNVGNNVRAFGGSVSKNVSKGLNEANTRFSDAKASQSKLKGFSFKNSRKNNLPGSPTRGASATGSTNLRTVWKEDNFHDEADDAGVGHGVGMGARAGADKQGQHKTWEQVARQKKRRRKIGLSVLIVLVASIVIGVSLSQTAWRWKYKNLWGDGNTHLDVTFYATSNTPFGYGTSEQQLVQDLATIPADAEFVAHLGNLQDADSGMCPPSRMSEVANLLHGQSQTNVPIFVVPGAHDWIKCPNQMSAWARWIAAFGNFEQTNSLVPGGALAAGAAGSFDRPKSIPEIFSKLHHGVLVFGLHLVSGTVTEGDGPEIKARGDQKMSIYVRGTLSRLAGQYRAVVMLGNARPGPQQRPFFDSIREDLNNAKVPTAYIHSHSGFGATEHYPYGRGKKSGKDDVLGSMVAIQAASGEANQAPLKITVGFGKQPFKIG